MRRFLIMIVVLAGGAGALWHFENKRQDEIDRNGGMQMADPVADPSRLDVVGEDLDEASGTSIEEGSTTSTTESGSEEEGRFKRYGDEKAVIVGGGSMIRNRREPGEPRIIFTVGDHVVLDGVGLAYDLMDVAFESYQVTPDDQDSEANLNSRLVASRARVQVDETVITGAFLQNNLEIELYEVTADIFAGTPFAPLNIVAPRLKGDLGEEWLRSIGEDSVTFQAREMRGSGQGLDARLHDGSLEFLHGADVQVDIGKGRTLKVSTPEGGPLSILDETPLAEGETPTTRNRDAGPRSIRVLARDGVHVELKVLDGSAPSEDRRVGSGELAGTTDELPMGAAALPFQPLTIDSASMEIQLTSYGGEQDPEIQTAWAWGKVTIRHGRDVYRGETARVYFENGEPVRVILEKEPTLTYTLREESGQEVELRMTGQGPITVHLGGGTEANPELRFVFAGPGSIAASSGRGGVVTFENEARGNGVSDRSRATVLLSGDVRVETDEGVMTSPALIATYRAGHDLRAATDGKTLMVGHNRETGERYHVRAEGGMSAHLVGSAWFVDRAANIEAESFGVEPHRISAGLITDADIAAQTLSATGSVSYESLWGRAQAKKALVRTATSVTLMGTPDELVTIDLISGTQGIVDSGADTAALRSGWIQAEELRLSAGEVVATSSVIAQVETLEGVWGFDTHELTLRREVTGESFVEDPDSPGPSRGAFRAGKMEDIFVTARFVREARYDTDKGNTVVAADRVEIEAGAAPVVPEAGGAKAAQAVLDPSRTAHLQAFGRVTIDMESYGPEVDEQGLPTVQQTWNLAAASATFERLPGELGSGSAIEAQPFELTAQEVTECRLSGASRLVELSCDAITINGEFAPIETEQSLAPDDLSGARILAEGHVNLRHKAALGEPAMVGRCHRLVLEGAERGRMQAERGRRVTVTAMVPESDLKYKVLATVVTFSEDRVTAEAVEGIKVIVELPTAVHVGSMGFNVKKVTTDKLVATKDSIQFSGPTVLTRVDEFGKELKPATATDLTVNTADLKQVQKSLETIGPFDPVPAQENDEEQEPRTQSGEMIIPLDGGGEVAFSASSIDQDGTIHFVDALFDFPQKGLSLDADWVAINRANCTIDAGRGTVRGNGELPWDLQFAGIESRILDDELMLMITAPRVRHGEDKARADYLCIWIDRARWQELWGGASGPNGELPAGDAPDQRPNFLAEILFEIQDREYGGHVRALFMEGGVEVIRGDRRAARGSRLYIDLPKAVAWLEDAELVYPLLSKGKEVPLRIRTKRLGTDEEGRLTAKDATLTTCDHDVPHFVVRTRKFSLEPRSDGRWRFGAKGNRLKFTDGVSLPLPSIGNLVLDEEFGVDGFENEAGEVTPLRDIGIARTARFGTVLGAAFRFDVGNIGQWLAERIGMNPKKIRGKWETEAQYLSGRGPLLGLGLQLREREPGDDPNEDFRLDAFVGGIVDGDEDRGTVRVPESDHDDLRITGYARARYPIVRGEWVDFAVSSQTDAGVQAEFYEGDFLRFDERDTFIRWRKSFGADYLSAGAQKRINSFRSQKEELPSFSAYRGERQVGTFTGLPVLWGGAFDVGYLRRREGDIGYDLFSDLPGGAAAGLGNHESARADLIQRLSIPIQTTVAGIRATPFLEARGTAWSNSLDDGDDPSRGAAYTGLELSTALHKVTDNGYLHALAPRISYATDIASNRTGGSLIPFDETEQAIDGTRYEVGLRSLWQRPGTFENLDFDVSAHFRQDRDDGLVDETELAVLSQYVTRYGDGEGQIGVRHDARYDLEDSETAYSRSSLAIRPNDAFLIEFRYSQARAIDETELYETGGILSRWRLDPKWELESRYAHDMKNDRQLLTELTVRRFAHDFVFDITFQDRSGEGGTNVSFNLMPLLGWTAARLGMLDR